MSSVKQQQPMHQLVRIHANYDCDYDDDVLMMMMMFIIMEVIYYFQTKRNLISNLRVKRSSILQHMSYYFHIVMEEDRKGIFRTLIFAELMFFEKPSACVREKVLTRIHCGVQLSGDF